MKLANEPSCAHSGAGTNANERTDLVNAWAVPEMTCHDLSCGPAPPAADRPILAQLNMALAAHFDSVVNPIIIIMGTQLHILGITR